MGVHSNHFRRDTRKVKLLWPECLRARSAVWRAQRRGRWHRVPQHKRPAECHIGVLRRERPSSFHIALRRRRTRRYAFPCRLAPHDKPHARTHGSDSCSCARVGFGSNLAARFQSRERPESVLPADRSTSREGLDFDESTAVDPIQKPAARAIPPQAVIRPQCQRS